MTRLSSLGVTEVNPDKYLRTTSGDREDEPIQSTSKDGQPAKKKQRVETSSTESILEDNSGKKFKNSPIATDQ